MTKQLRVFSSGGGQQSIAALVLSARGEIDYQTHLFANVGDDSEHPATLRYVREVAMPYAAAHGVAYHELHRVRRDGTAETLYERLTRAKKGIGIPMRTPGKPPMVRSCTVDFKVKVVGKWLKAHGATPTTPAIVGLGISLDELQRMTTAHDAIRVLDYPLVTLRLTRGDCVRVIEDAGLPIPPRSSCWWCPFHSLAVWQRMRHEEPDLFERSVALEALLSDRHQRDGHGPAYMTDRLKPLPMATTDHTQGALFSEIAADTCESGWCMT